ncbi:Txe/YoeB family toxin of Txe-Axe toxin-antitoxin module [Sphingobium jiangsuense]|uniref:Txe/YoeB family toxin of Txe-Axe toxin-antitoxin module n=1 Tax=Sphingobium jiangsuense TaxID=870476 RepID=A0A7W6BIA1_9SPHN|nr:type II toxin-antitoxin system YoeB family toxin [Sphingobium jiangsuense]MBB3925427.1 Txe/YoeB family toxin of Txe-Axe toxin-antitoxin module [Sphingobium jiangsuense]
MDGAGCSTDWWSRRINQADRPVYRVEGAGDAQRLEIAQCRFHYD